MKARLMALIALSSVAGLELLNCGVDFHCVGNLDCEDGYLCIESECIKASEAGLVACDYNTAGVCAPYDCDSANGYCKSTCDRDYDCGESGTCSDGSCVAETCTEDSDCGYFGEYRCNLSSGTCYTSCTSDSECQNDHTCTKGKCLAD